MSTLTDKEKEAAKILEFNDFNECKRDVMVADMNYCYEGKYRRQERRDLFKTILGSTVKKQAILKLIEQSRSTSHRLNIALIMTDEEVERVIADQNHDNNDAIKYWYYSLYPSFSPTEIKERHEDAMASISQHEIDQYEHREELILHAEHWMEFYEFNLPDTEMEIAADLFRSMTKSKYRDLTVRMCLKAVQNIYKDPTPARMRMERKTKSHKAPIKNDELDETLEKITNEWDFDEGSPEQKDAFVKELFVNNWDDYTVNEIKEQALGFYTGLLGNNEFDGDDFSPSVVTIDSDDSDESGENPSSPPSKRIRIK